ncbi:MAG: alpha-hydroxy-acid oxidizing protein [Pseudomonadota bacterium]|nr:alpha-hydroxy-acid oxidizing protein [Pseudomonadota bacterium]
MEQPPASTVTRRAFMYGMSALPVCLARAKATDPSPAASLFTQRRPPVTSAEQVLNVMAFEPLAQKALPPAHFGYIATGVDDDRTLVRNPDAYRHYEIRARRFADLSRLDMTQSVWGARWPSPVYLSAVSSMRAFHPDAELAVARAARGRSMQMMLATGTSAALGNVIEARGAPLWQQIYPTDDWAVTARIVGRAEDAGCTAVVLTVDSPGPRNNETLRIAMQTDSRRCINCHPGNSHDMWRRSPMFAGIDVSQVTGLAPTDLNLAFLDRFRALVKGRLIVKGIVTAEDAALSVEHGADGIIVSNHGGRNEETLRATVDCLPEVVAAVSGRVPVFVDGGIRRGTDIFKALALGATAVGIGRPQAWGLAAFGQPGVEAVIDILHRELLAIMRQAGTVSIRSISGAHIVRSGDA